MTLKIIEIKTRCCDICDKPLIETMTAEEMAEYQPTILGWNGEEFEIDLCPKDKAQVGATFDGWIAIHLGTAVAKKTRVPKAKAPRQAKEPVTETKAERKARNDKIWSILEKGDFIRHRGTLSTEEREYLDAHR